MSNYYETLGVSNTATPDEIKKAYRQKAKQYHPDTNHDPGAEEKFKEIQEAYDTLSDTQKRSKYDNPISQQSQFDNFHFNPFQHTQVIRVQHPPIKIVLNLTLEEFHKGTSIDVSYQRYDTCEICNGTRGAGTTTCLQCGGTGEFSPLSFVKLPCHGCNGSGQIVKDPCTTCSGSGQQLKTRTLKIHVPTGMTLQHMLQYKEGHMDPTTKQPGLVLISLNELPHDRFSRTIQAPFDLIFNHELSFSDAVNGTKLSIVDIENTKIEVNIPPRTSYTSTLKCEKLGLNYHNTRGNLIINLSTKFPTEEETKHVKQ